jgi:hypothetical protein
MPAAPPARRNPVNVIGGTSVPDPTTDRVIGEVREQVDRLRRQVATSAGGSLTIAADLEFNDFSALEVHTMEMTNLGSSPGVPSRIYMIGDEWYVSDGNGNEIQITNGGALDVSGTVDLYGDQQRFISLKDFSTVSGSTGGSHNGYSIIEANSINTQFVFGPLPLRVGERLKAFRVRVNKNSTGTMTVQFNTSTDGGALTTSGSSGTSSTSGLQTIAVTLASPVTTLQDTVYFLSVTCPNVSDRIHAMSLVVDKVV